MSRIKVKDRIFYLEEDWGQTHKDDESPTDCYRYCPSGLAPVNEEPVFFLYGYDEEKKEMCYHWVKTKYPFSIFAMGKDYKDVVPDEIEEDEMFMLDWDWCGGIAYTLWSIKDYIDSHNIDEVRLANHKTSTIKKRKI